MTAAIPEYVTLAVAGFRWRAWTRASVSYSAKQAARSFAFTVVDASPFAGAWNFMPGEECSVYANADLVCKGFINTMSPSYDATHHKVEISGRSKGQDSIDSSAEHDKSEFKNVTPLDIAKALDKQGVGFSTNISLPTIPVFRLNPGETVFQAVERACRRFHLLLTGQADGSILITKGGSTRTHPALIEGFNILGASATFDDGEKHSDYKVRGQRAFGSQSKKSIRIESTATDDTVKRYRPKIIHSETDTDEAQAKTRAETHRDRKQGESIKASVKVQGWRDDTGAIWQANTLVYVKSPLLKLDMDLLIESVNLTQDDQGTLSQLTLVQPKALGSDASSGSKTAGPWKFDPDKTPLPQPKPDPSPVAGVNKEP